MNPINRDTAHRLESLYQRINRREFVHPDPLEFLYAYESVRDREIVALIASSLAYGRVAQILASVRKILSAMGSSPADFLAEEAPDRLDTVLCGFKHRFATGAHIRDMLAGAGAIIDRDGSLYRGFLRGYRAADPTIVPALDRFCLRLSAAGDPGHLIPLPRRGSACKRMNLFLRWMVRSDAVDPGGWPGIPLSKLIVPLDVHMHRMALRLGLTRRNALDLATALEVTAGFSQWVPEDPVRYDFALTRLGIRSDMTVEDFL
ncbi:TIGR02757 family protein [Desulfococcus sp.]|uniref:TIGR02757 family protein n=1 Tax=Desulfococcus sp. TaxID=2025834 RepID=UPI003593770F